MALPLQPPIEPQLARGKPELPVGEGWSTSPSTTASGRSRSSTARSCMLQSRGGKPLQRYFPELQLPAGRYVLDGEIVIDARSRTPMSPRTSTRSRSASTRPPRGSSCSRSRRRPATSPSICWRVDDESLLDAALRRAPPPARGARAGGHRTGADRRHRGGGRALAAARPRASSPRA